MPAPVFAAGPFFMTAAPVDSSLPLIEGRGLSLRRGGHWLVREADIAVEQGEVVTLVGPNGGGKTTLVRMLLGLVRPNAGTVQRRADVSIGYVPQRLHMDSTLPLTVGRLMTSTARNSRARVREALAETGAGALVGKSAANLSNGEFQRVLLARALLRSPNLLILDEPLQGVDHTGETELYELITAIGARRHCGVLMVSHDLRLALASADQVVCLNQRIYCAGPPQEVMGHPEFHRLFGPYAEAHAASQRLFARTHAGAPAERAGDA